MRAKIGRERLTSTLRWDRSTIIRETPRVLNIAIGQDRKLRQKRGPHENQHELSYLNDSNYPQLFFAGH